MTSCLRILHRKRHEILSQSLFLNRNIAGIHNKFFSQNIFQCNGLLCFQQNRVVFQNCVNILKYQRTAHFIDHCTTIGNVTG